MKNYKKGLLTVMILSAMSLMAAEDKKILVTTFVDEDGENSNACSLREAIKTAKLDKSYGGCNVGRRLAIDGSAPDVIQLKEGEYKLEHGELVVESAVKIEGENIYSYTGKSPITNQYPTIVPIKTTINAQGKSRIFNTLASQAPLNIYNIRLKDGYTSGDGGAIYTAGSVGVYASELINNKAEGEGAAIYAVAMDVQQSIKIQETHIQKNIAKGTGSILAMDCIGNLGATQTNVEVLSSSIVENGSTQSSTLFDFCGYATATFENNTIAKNTSHPNGHIIRMINQPERPLNGSSSLYLANNTIVENTARSALIYDNIGEKVLAYNVLAYNSGLSCEYALNNGIPAESERINLTSITNAIQKTGAGSCILPERKQTINVSNENIDLSQISMSSVLSQYLAPSATTRYLGLYYPRDNQTANDLINVGTKECSNIDQRGIDRIKFDLMLDPTNKNTCDIGSVEMRYLIAHDITDLKNESHVDLLKSFQSNIDALKDDIANKDTPADELPEYEAELKEFENLKKLTEQYDNYRAIYINPFIAATPEETLQSNQIQMKILNNDNYDVITKSIGVGNITFENGQANFEGTPDNALKCEWKPDLKRIIMYRTDGKETNSIENELCSYTLKDKRSGRQATGLIKAQFVNIAPIAVNDEYLIRREDNLVTTVNPLENDSDDGDGSTSSIGLKRAAFYHNAEGLEIPIRIVKLPAGVTLKAERQGTCPDPYPRETCYGGKLTFSVSNTFSQSSYNMEYNIFDAEEKMSSTAVINLKNTVKDTNTSSGGGSTGFWSILGLLGLIFYRRYSCSRIGQK